MFPRRITDLYNIHGHKLRFPVHKRAQFVTTLSINKCTSISEKFTLQSIYRLLLVHLLLIMLLSNIRIKKLFHYRRVSELFHIAQAAFLAEQVWQKKSTS